MENQLPKEIEDAISGLESAVTDDACWDRGHSDTTNAARNDARATLGAAVAKAIEEARVAARRRERARIWRARTRVGTAGGTWLLSPEEARGFAKLLRAGPQPPSPGMLHAFAMAEKYFG